MHSFIRQAVVLSLFSGFLIAGGMASRAQSLRAVDIEAEEQQAETLIEAGINTERARLAPGAGRLASDSALERMARERSYDMAHGAPFAHEDEKGRFVAAEMVKKNFGPYGAIGENIMMERDDARAFDPGAFARRAVRGWMNSEGHRANILAERYNRAGVGVVIEGSYAYATQLFWGPARPPLGASRGR
ncbi:MAG TPA: CAP domain-containing protein [Micropepsaceae bacterium]|nr:CAP domain-containing protein [Micropepsaceae bacterium]